MSVASVEGEIFRDLGVLALQWTTGHPSGFDIVYATRVATGVIKPSDRTRFINLQFCQFAGITSPDLDADNFQLELDPLTLVSPQKLTAARQEEQRLITLCRNNTTDFDKEVRAYWQGQADKWGVLT